MSGRIPDGHEVVPSPDTDRDVAKVFDLIESKPEWTHPDPELRWIIRRLAGLGVAKTNIVRCVGVSAKLLDEHYSATLETATVRVNAMVANELLRSCMRGNVQAQVAWLKMRDGWTERTVLEHSGPDGGPMQVQVYVPHNGREDDERLKIATSYPSKEGRF